MTQLNSCFHIPASLFLAKKKKEITGPFTFKTQRKRVTLACL